MNINRLRTIFVCVIVGAAALAMLFLGAANSQAAPDVGDRPSLVGFDPQPDPPTYSDPHKPGSIRGFDPQPDPPGIKISVTFGQ